MVWNQSNSSLSSVSVWISVVLKRTVVVVYNDNNLNESHGSEDNFRSGCRNVSHYQQQLSFQN